MFPNIFPTETKKTKGTKVASVDLIDDLKEYLKELHIKADAGEGWASDEIESILIRIKELESQLGT